ncbi:MAG: helix-hairpin-helix domain-containing protein [Corynebacterium humireducens]|uniref:Helix-hairpin-helix domain-containing protein n=1 Tax=Corynebacterium humireducens TaxID=1223514 RepID=A0A7X6SVL0_9CORY|nr:helix-hairpin-helix domain-containing protein [Corynebacterium humireducens]
MPFHPAEREILLAVRYVGPTVVSRLEQLGYTSLGALAAADPTDILDGGAAATGSTCWRNSPQARKAVEGAVSAARAHSHPKR